MWPGRVRSVSDAVRLPVYAGRTLTTGGKELLDSLAYQVKGKDRVKGEFSIVAHVIVKDLVPGASSATAVYGQLVSRYRRPEYVGRQG